MAAMRNGLMLWVREVGRCQMGRACESQTEGFGSLIHGGTIKASLKGGQNMGVIKDIERKKAIERTDDVTQGRPGGDIWQH